MHMSFKLLNWYNNLYMQFICKQNKRKMMLLWNMGTDPESSNPDSPVKELREKQVTSWMSREQGPG